MSTTVNTTTNTVTISESENSVQVTNNNTGTSVDVTGMDSPIITVASPGPKGDTGTFSIGSDLNIATITASGAISTSGVITAAEFVGALSTTASSAISASFATTSSFATTADSATTATTATNANNVYVDANDTSTSAFHLPMYQPSVGDSGYDDGHYQLKNPINEVFYYSRGTNPVTNASQQSDYLLIGGGQNTTGGIFFNSTVQTEPFIYSDFNRMYIKADDRFGANNATYPARLELSTYTGSFAATGVPNYISLESTEIRITGSISTTSDITASGDISASGNIFASNFILPADGTITPSTNNQTIKFTTKPPGAVQNGEMLTIGPDLIEAKGSSGNAALSSMLRLDSPDGGQREVVFNNDGNDIDFSILSDNLVAFKLNASNDMMAFRNHVGIGKSSNKWPTDDYTLTGTPTYQLMVMGKTNLTGSVDIEGPLTASGNISASGTVESNGLILTSPDGTRYQISVDNSGNLSTSAV